MAVQPRIAGILLAAGAGSRLGQPKALVEVGGQRLVDRGVELLRAGGTEPIVVVTGAAQVTPPGTLVVHNPQWRTGMGSSLIAGLAALQSRLNSASTAPRSGMADPDAGSTATRGHVGIGPSAPAGPSPSTASIGAAVIALADQPLIGAESVRRLIAAFADGASVAVATYDGRPRNPVLIAREHWDEVMAMAHGDVGARPFLRAHPELVTPVECGDTGSPDDIDTPEQLARVASVLRGGRPA